MGGRGKDGGIEERQKHRHEKSKTKDIESMVLCLWRRGPGHTGQKQKTPQLQGLRGKNRHMMCGEKEDD